MSNTHPHLDKFYFFIHEEDAYKQRAESRGKLFNKLDGLTICRTLNSGNIFQLSWDM